MNRPPSIARPRISRAQAFSEQGVRLTYPARSWSGVRDCDGAVVIALREAEVQRCLEGFRCLLWSPVIEGATEWVDRPIKAERLAHCRLAAAFGGADGLVASGPGAQMEPGNVLELRVERRNGEYWAFWGNTALAAAERVPAHPFRDAREPALLAA